MELLRVLQKDSLMGMPREFGRESRKESEQGLWQDLKLIQGQDKDIHQNHMDLDDQDYNSSHSNLLHPIDIPLYYILLLHHTNHLQYRLLELPYIYQQEMQQGSYTMALKQNNLHQQSLKIQFDICYQLMHLQLLKLRQCKYQQRGMKYNYNYNF